MDLIVVESPTKAKTLNRFLAGKYAVEASYGHVRDLPEKKLGIKTDGNFEPEYVQTAKQKERTDIIKKLSENADKVYLATDPDREGEAIAFHVEEVLKGSNTKTQKTNHKNKFVRVAFHEITERAIKEAMANPREIDIPLVDAQQARRVLDRLVGYKLSPLLWRKIRKGLSAGRVQSVAVRLIVEREREIEAFKPLEYWNLFARLETGNKEKFTAQLTDKITTGEEALRAENDLKLAQFWVENVAKRDIKRTPPPPFTTSTLQQAAANKFGWSAKKTMQTAQSLYEQGFITYHRTDSTNLAAEAVNMAKDYISAKYGREFALDKARLYATKNKVAQEAHEAIRPSNLEAVPSVTNRDEHRLYDLVWKRFTACQMAEAAGTSVKVTIKAGEYSLEAKGETLTFLGWLKLYEKDKVEDDEDVRENDAKIPDLTAGDKLTLEELVKEQKWTQPPARYNDASLIKTLEEKGIGRPSTYAPTLSTIQERQYVERVEKRFKPTALGIAVNDFLVANFNNIVDYQFTARMEEELDEIANGDLKWQPVIGDFYKPFEEKLASVQDTAARVKVETETTGEKCPECHEGDVVIRLGKFGKFLACSRYPECKYRANFVQKAGVACPKCGGDVILRHTKTKKPFYGCSNYPKCDFASWNKPKAPETPVAK